MNKSTCIQCERPAQARELCSSHYSTWYRANQQRTKKCAWCGQSFKTGRADVKHCGASCGSKYARSQKAPLPTKPAPPKKTQGELQELWRGQRSAFRAAYEDHDYPTFLAELEKRCTITSDACWEWNGKKSNKKNVGSRYPQAVVGKKTLQVHRMSLEAKLQAPLGSQQSHHTCANTLCVNPDHLEAATHVENIAEMKARRSYEARINELEAALSEINPTHPLLDRAAYGT